MHHPTDRINIPRLLLHQSWSTGWNETSKGKSCYPNLPLASEFQGDWSEVFRCGCHDDFGDHVVTGVEDVIESLWQKSCCLGNPTVHNLHTVLREPEGGNVLFNDALNTFYLWLYGIRHMVKDYSDSKKRNLLLPHGLLFLINGKGSFICTIPQTG